MQTPYSLLRAVRSCRVVPVALALGMALALGGCVQRRLTIRSDPPGARVYVGDEEIGTTPASTDFVYYGTRKIRLVKDGYETLVVNQPIPAPWYQIPPLDFVAENVVPGEIRDERVVNYQLVPLQPRSTEQLLARADQVRATTVVPPVALVAPAMPAAVAPGTLAPGAPIIGAPAPTILPEPAAGAVIGPPAGQGGAIFSPPSGSRIFPPPANPTPVIPANPPPYNPPQYLPPG
jgi:hypothetical protein